MVSHMSFRDLRSAIIFPLCLALAGCGGEEKDLPTTVPVTGSVSYNGAPVEGALVSFQSATVDSMGNAAKPATGTTGPDGRFQLSTYVSGTDLVPGALPGEYKVTVSKTETPAAPTGQSVEEQMRQQMMGGEMPEPKHLLPEKYASPETTDLTATVGADGAADLEFSLTD